MLGFSRGESCTLKAMNHSKIQQCIHDIEIFAYWIENANLLNAPKE